MAISKTNAIYRKGGATINHTPTANVPAGKILVVCGLVCIAQWALTAGTRGVLKVLQRGEVIAVETDEAIGATTAGTAIYVDSSGLVTKTASSNRLIGYAAEEIGATDKAFDIVCA